MFQSVSKAPIDKNLKTFQEIKMGSRETIAEYWTIIETLINEYQDNRNSETQKRLPDAMGTEQANVHRQHDNCPLGEHGTQYLSTVWRRRLKVIH